MWPDPSAHGTPQNASWLLEPTAALRRSEGCRCRIAWDPTDHLTKHGEPPTAIVDCPYHGQPE